MGALPERPGNDVSGVDVRFKRRDGRFCAPPYHCQPLIAYCRNSAAQGFAWNLVPITIQACQTALIAVEPRFSAACHPPTVMLAAAGEAVHGRTGGCCGDRGGRWNGLGSLGPPPAAPPPPWGITRPPCRAPKTPAPPPGFCFNCNK